MTYYICQNLQQTAEHTTLQQCNVFDLNVLSLFLSLTANSGTFLLKNWIKDAK